MGPWRVRAHRLCMRCQIGTLLTPAPEAGLRHDDPFVIIDQQFTVRALSQRAEVALGIEEPVGANVPLEQLLVSDNGDRNEVELVRSIARALTGKSQSGTLALRRVGNPGLRFLARITSCGPPAAVLLILTRRADQPSSSAKRLRLVAPNEAAVEEVLCFAPRRRSASTTAKHTVGQARR
jgi:hypothetical protein